LTSESELLEDLRPRAFAIAYRMLGSVSEAEDVVQEALIRVHAAIDRGEEVSSPRAYAATITTRRAIDELRSARARRETYVGEWLPEPIATGPEDDPEGRAEMADSLSLAFLTLLESLTPEQRGALLLHDVFDYGYREVAEILQTSEENARQLASRGRGQVAALESLLAEDVELHGDGGGLAPAIKHPVFGRVKAAKMLTNWWQLGQRMGGLRFRRVVVNGQPGAEYVDPDGGLIGVLALDIGEGRIQAIRSVVNPEKLGHLGPVADANALLARIRESR
jgi:RNA polymerase sigma factor (sigma-70 family)